MIYDEIIKGLKPENVHMNEQMSKHTSFKVGGVADYYVIVQDVNELIYILKMAKQLKTKVFIIGNGTNILCKDTGFRGIIVKLDFKVLKVEDNYICAGAGVPVALLSEYAYRHSIKDYEFLCGIPGTIGGAIKMNAGAYGGEIKDVIVEITVLDEHYKIKTITADEADFSYRHSIFFNKNWIILGAKFKITKGDKEKIKAKREENQASRRSKQPLEYPSAGSVFKRKENCIPAKLIDDAGLKGYQIGGAQISEKHSGFIINKDNATAKDIIKLIKYTKEKVKEEFGEELELEIIVL